MGVNDLDDQKILLNFVDIFGFPLKSDKIINSLHEDIFVSEHIYTAVSYIFI
jgi:hypothetical protein